MSAGIRLYSFTGTMNVPRVGGQDLVLDAVHFLKWPYLAGEVLSTTAPATAASAAATAPKYTQVIFYQVDPGKRVHYELQPDGQSRPVTTNSPYLTGEGVLPFGQGWILNVLESSIS